MTESINRLTSDEINKAVRQALYEIGSEGASQVAEQLIEREAEKVASEITDPKKRRGAELVVFRTILDKLEAAYAEELSVHETGEEPTYDAGDLNT